MIFVSKVMYMCFIGALEKKITFNAFLDFFGDITDVIGKKI